MKQWVRSSLRIPRGVMFTGSTEVASLLQRNVATRLMPGTAQRRLIAKPAA